MKGGEEGVALGAMLEHPSWAGVVPLAGLPEAEDRRVSGVVMRPGLDGGVPEDVAGRLLAVLFPCDRFDWRLDTLLRRARSAGAVAVLLGGTEPVRQATAALADRLGLPVLGAADPLAAGNALDTMTARPRLVRADAVVRTAALCRRTGEGVDELLQALGGLLHRPVALLQHDGLRIAGEEVLHGDEPGAVASWLAGLPVARLIDLPTGAQLVTEPLTPRGGSPRLVVRLPGRLRAECDAVSAALEVAAGAVQERLALHRVALERDARRRASLLGELRHLDGDVPQSVRRRALEVGWRLDGWHTGIRIGAAPDTDVAGLRAEVVAAFEAECLEAAVVEQGEGWSVWTTTERQPTVTAIRDQAAAVRRVQRRLPPASEPYVGVGRAHPGPEGIGRSLAEAGDAARLARGRAETGRFFHVDRLGMAQLLLAWTRTDTFQPAARSLLEPLAGEAGDLVRTLAAYLDAESSVAETAAVLGVHRNTVTARVTRIQQVLGVDLTDPDERLALHLACRTAILPAAEE